MITVVIWKIKALYKCHLTAQQPFLCHILSSKIDVIYLPLKIYNCSQTILFIGVNVNFSGIDKNPHHIKVKKKQKKNEQCALVLPDIF